MIINGDKKVSNLGVAKALSAFRQSPPRRLFHSVRRIICIMVSNFTLCLLEIRIES